MTENFQRVMRFQMGQPGELGREWTIAGVRGRLTITGTVTVQPGKQTKSNFEVVNLSHDSISIAQQEGTLFRIFAGYDVPRLIFEGVAIRHGLNVYREGGSLFMKVEAKSGGNRYKRSKLNVTLSGEVTAQELLDKAAEEMGIPTGILPASFDDVRLTQGVSLNGKTSRVLKRIGDMIGADIQSHNGALDVIPRDGDTGEPVVRFATETGNLLRFKRKEEGIEFEGLLDGRCRSGRRVQIDHVDPLGNRTSGAFKLRDVTYDFDSNEGPFYVTCTAKESS